VTTGSLAALRASQRADKDMRQTNRAPLAQVARG
jgi:hypothetical protein